MISEAPFKLNLSTRGFNVGPVVGLPPGISVFLDGVRQNEPDAAEVNFDLLPMEHVQRVELLSGSGVAAGPQLARRSHQPHHPAGQWPARSGGRDFGRLLRLLLRRGIAWRSQPAVAGTTMSPGDMRTRTAGVQATGAENLNGFVNLGRRGPDRGISFQAFGAESRAETAGSLPESIFDSSPTDQLHGR